MEAKVMRLAPGGGKSCRGKSGNPLPIPPPQAGEGGECGCASYCCTADLARVDFDTDERRFLMGAATSTLRVHVDREASRRIGGERHLDGRARRDAFLDVVAVQMYDERLIARPSQFHDIALFDPDQPHVLQTRPRSTLMSKVSSAAMAAIAA